MEYLLKDSTTAQAQPPNITVSNVSLNNSGSGVSGDAAQLLLKVNGITGLTINSSQDILDKNGDRLISDGAPFFGDWKVHIQTAGTWGPSGFHTAGQTGTFVVNLGEEGKQQIKEAYILSAGALDNGNSTSLLPMAPRYFTRTGADVENSPSCAFITRDPEVASWLSLNSISSYSPLALPATNPPALAAGATVGPYDTRGWLCPNIQVGVKPAGYQNSFTRAENAADTNNGWALFSAYLDNEGDDNVIRFNYGALYDVLFAETDRPALIVYYRIPS